MRKYRKNVTIKSKGSQLKSSIARNRARAEFVGFIYLLAIFALAVAVCFPLIFAGEGSPSFCAWKVWSVFTIKNVKAWRTAEVLLQLVSGALYAIILIAALINVLRAISKLGWLFKRRASKTYGFNRNAYAMEDLGRMFSGLFAMVLIHFFLIGVMYGKLDFNYLTFIVLGGGILIRLFAGFVGGKVGYYDIEEGEIIAERRVVKRFAPLFRNFFQFAAIFGMMYFVLKANTLHTVVAPLLQKGGVKDYLLEKPLAYVSMGTQLLTVLCMIPLINHAVGMSEFNIDGAEGKGMKTFTVFSLFVLLTAGATVVCRAFLGEALLVEALGSYAQTVVKFTGKKGFDWNSLIVAGIALFMFVLQLIMRKAPKFPKQDTSEFEDGELNFAPYAQTEPATIYPKKANRENGQLQYQNHYYITPPPAPAPAPQLQPTAPAVNILPMVAFNQNAPAQEEVEEIVEEVKEESLEVGCPTCGRWLRVNASSSYNRCPACGKVFELRKVTKDVIV